jgi:hypothetical protein
VWNNAGTPLTGVTVTLALRDAPPGAVLTGNTAVSDVNGIATFPALTVNVVATGVSLQATAAAPGTVAGGTSVPFDVGTLATTWSASGSGAVVTVNAGASGQPVMQYQNSGAGIFSGAWTFTAVSAQTRTIDLSYAWDGFHSYFQVTARLEVFVNRGGSDVSVVTLLNQGPVNCCSTPSGGFFYSGATSVSVQAGDTYGFRLYGSHGDSAYTLQGRFSVGIDHAPVLGAATPPAIAPGQMIVLRGRDMPATGASGILFNQGAGDLPASYLFFSAPDPTNEVVIARSPAGLVPGPATVRSAGGPLATLRLPITISSVPGAPVLRALKGSANCAGPDLTSVSPGQTVYVLADGVDTSHTTFYWTTSSEGEPISLTTGTVATMAGPGSICTQSSAPTAQAGFTGGTWSLAITTTVGASTSPLSGSIFFTVP